MSNTWKVGDEFWIDYEKLVKTDKYKSEMRYWTMWFPPEDQPFTIVRVGKRRADIFYDIEAKNEFEIYSDVIYNKSMIINQILNEL